VRSFGLTDTGKVRSTNQDQFLVAVLLKSLRVEQTSLPQQSVQQSSDRSHLFVVADGMGGHAGGEQASAMAIDSVETFILGTFKWFAQFKEPEQDQVLADFQTALGEANARVLAEAKDWPELRGMGTTLTLAYSLNEVLFVAHVGDTRCYLRRKGVLHRLTHDHTLVEELVRNGIVAVEDASKHHLRHVITNAVGGSSANLKVEIHKLQLEGDDRVLLCSDGLTGMLRDEQISQILEIADEPEEACRQLIAHANEAGGRDNITVVVADFRIGTNPESRATENLGDSEIENPQALLTGPASVADAQTEAVVAET
jgi:serine/threonine protein phosphatase PrpC